MLRQREVPVTNVGAYVEKSNMGAQAEGDTDIAGTEREYKGRQWIRKMYIDRTERKVLTDSGDSTWRSDRIMSIESSPDTGVQRGRC